VVVEIDESPDSIDVLEAGIGEARLRRAPLTVLTTSKFGLAGIGDDTHDESACAQLHKRLTHHRVMNPDVEFNPITVGTTTSYLDRQTGSVQLLVIGRNRRRGLGEIVGSAHTIPHQINCSVLICQQHRHL
jgi:hypothetical protein